MAPKTLPNGGGDAPAKRPQFFTIEGNGREWGKFDAVDPCLAGKLHMRSAPRHLEHISWLRIQWSLKPFIKYSPMLVAARLAGRNKRAHEVLLDCANRS